ncbi:hypothetical protein [uncultured Maritimibacter sp.]|jgi:hypothetical protein|uniref:hypothetical protein n=1 Tax=uncultured Maritimibacter sp. TaxID=991866 RepID=UPI002611C9BD|nr:hypothetical protein [uncultured Maritimibacter sp.]
MTIALPYRVAFKVVSGAISGKRRDHFMMIEDEYVKLSSPEEPRPVEKPGASRYHPAKGRKPARENERGG